MRSATAFLSKDKYSYVELEIEGGSVRSPSFPRLFAQTGKKKYRLLPLVFPYVRIRVNAAYTRPIRRSDSNADTVSRSQVARFRRTRHTTYDGIQRDVRIPGGVVRPIKSQSVRVSGMRTSNSRRFEERTGFRNWKLRSYGTGLEITLFLRHIKKKNRVFLIVRFRDTKQFEVGTTTVRYSRFETHDSRSLSFLIGPAVRSVFASADNDRNRIKK